jgi:hypothetical protein
VTAPRIDTVRRHANAAIHAITQALEHLDDLHAIGWYRHANNTDRQRVAGGTPDWSLDNHGDPQARAAYEQLAQGLLTTHRTATDAVTGALAIFDTGTIRQRRDRTADATTPEILTALARQAKRQAAGEHHSAPLVTQPLPAGARRLLDHERLTTELEDLRSCIRKTGQRPPDRLTPRELTAWHNATGTTRTRRKKARTP